MLIHCCALGVNVRICRIGFVTSAAKATAGHSGEGDYYPVWTAPLTWPGRKHANSESARFQFSDGQANDNA
jgi:hypothetical protein